MLSVGRECTIATITFSFSHGLAGIDQSNIAERGAQVSIMGSIYSSAHCVNIWLGECGPWWEWSPFTFRQTMRLLRCDIWRRIRPPHQAIGHFNTEGIPAVAMLSALRRTRPSWHKRLWVVQEVAKARKLRICFGRYQQSAGNYAAWSYMFIGGDFIKALDTFNSILTSDRPGAINVTLRQQSASTIFGIIRRLDGAKLDAQDPHDYVYSMPSLLQPVSRLSRSNAPPTDACSSGTMSRFDDFHRWIVISEEC